MSLSLFDWSCLFSGLGGSFASSFLIFFCSRVYPSLNLIWSLLLICSRGLIWKGGSCRDSRNDDDFGTEAEADAGPFWGWESDCDGRGGAFEATADFVWMVGADGLLDEREERCPECWEEEWEDANDC